MAGLLNGQNLDDLTLKYVIDQELKNAGGGGGSQADIDAIKAEIGTTPLPTTAQTLTGAIAEHEGDISTLTADVSGKVSKSGDTMTGDLTISKSDDTPKLISKNPNIDTTNTTLPSATAYAGVYFRDGNDSNAGYCETAQSNTGLVRTDLVARRLVNNTATLNRLRLIVDPDGSRRVDLGTAVDAWLAALGLGSASTTSTISDIISAASGATITSLEYAEWGKVAMLKFSVSRNAVTSTTAVGVGTLKSGKRPAIDTNIISSTGRVFGTISASNGQVSIRTALGTSDLSANTSVTIRATYILA